MNINSSLYSFEGSKLFSNDYYNQNSFHESYHDQSSNFISSSYLTNKDQMKKESSNLQKDSKSYSVKNSLSFNKENESFSSKTLEHRSRPLTFEIALVSILYDPPVEACQLKPYILLKSNDGSHKPVDEDDTIRYRWSRGEKRICAGKNCKLGASFQCLVCLRSNISSYFCSIQCFESSWIHHKLLHKKNNLPVNWYHDDYIDLKIQPENKISCYFPPPLKNEWQIISTNKCYTPTNQDVGTNLLLECSVVSPPTFLSSTDPQNINLHWHRTETSTVLASPSPPPPRSIIYNLAPSHSPLSRTPFKVVCYNCLAEIYATKSLYPYCPMWCLAWNFRCNNLLREILNYNSDIYCLQEIQGNHFEDFWKPKLYEAGYDGIFKAKTRESIGQTPNSVDGCAIFYRRARFCIIEQYTIEFNNLIRAYADHHNPILHNNQALRRVLKGNVALITVFEDLTSDGLRRNKRRLCVANTHIFWDPQYEDVKLWQTYILCSELEKLVLSRNLPLICCGDFNIPPNSAVYDLVTTGQVSVSHPVFSELYNPLHVLPPSHSMINRLPLSSAYATVSGEPKYTNFTGHFVGILDYIFFGKSNLFPLGVLDVDHENHLASSTALPSPQYSSDHIALSSEFDWIIN